MSDLQFIDSAYVERRFAQAASHGRDRSWLVEWWRDRAHQADHAATEFEQEGRVDAAAACQERAEFFRRMIEVAQTLAGS